MKKRCNFCSQSTPVLVCSICAQSTCGTCGYLAAENGWTCELCVAASGPRESVLRSLLQATLNLSCVPDCEGQDFPQLL